VQQPSNHERAEGDTGQQASAMLDRPTPGAGT
jgi:hypothetical protein